MITIVVTHEDDQSDEFDFSPSQPTITIGRRSTNDVCIPNLSVSGRHARIAFSKGEAWIEDLNSTNGTYINNRLISRQILNNNDELVIGKTRVRFFDSANQHAAIQAEPAEVIDIRDADPANAVIERGEFNEIDEPGELSREVNMSDTGSPRPNDPYDDDGLDDILGENEPNQSTVSAEHLAGAGLAAAGTVGAVASTRASQSANNDVSDSESMFEALADDLSHRDHPEPRDNIEAADAHKGHHREHANDIHHAASNASLDDSSQMSLSDRAKVALGRDASRPAAVDSASPAEGRAANVARNSAEQNENPVDLSTRRKVKKEGATIQIKNGAKSGHVIPIDKPVTTLGRPGIQIAAIMRKPDGYFLMHIESNDSVDRPTLNNDFIGDEPMLLHPGDELNVAGINVEFDLVSQQVGTTA